MRLPVILFFSFVLFCCEQKKAGRNSLETDTPKTQVKYAQGFKVTSFKGATMVEVTCPFQGATTGITYLLVPRGQPVPEHDSDIKVVFTPLNSIVCTSTTHIPFLDYLGETDKLIGFPSTNYISSVKTRKRIDDGNVEELGIDKGMNLEKLVSLKPDVVMGYIVSSDYGQFKKIEELGVRVIINAEYLEKHPLGRAEWIKFMALFFNKEARADSAFQLIEKKYNETKNLVADIKEHPTVLSGVVYGDTWFLPGGKNYASTLLKDAGCSYLWADDPSNGFLQLSFESVYETAHAADLWIGVASFESLAEIKNSDQRYARFRPYVTKQVYTYNVRKGATGGSEFMELGYLRPDIVLQDIVKIAHPDVLPEYELYFHKKIE